MKRKISTRRKLGCCLLFVSLIANPYITHANLLERYKASKEEKSLYTQIKAYRKNAIENMRVFGQMEQGPYPLPRSNQRIIKEWHQENPDQPPFKVVNTLRTKKKK